MPASWTRVNILPTLTAFGALNALNQWMVFRRVFYVYDVQVEYEVDIFLESSLYLALDPPFVFFFLAYPRRKTQWTHESRT